MCVRPFAVDEWVRQIALLQPVLDRFHTESLGKWTFVLVGSDDWKRIAEHMHVDPNSPAFSHLEMRQTFLEEALLTPKPARQLELLDQWHIPFGQLLDFAVSHELGHVFCREPDEIKAEQAAQRLRTGQAAICGTRRTRTPKVASLLDSEDGHAGHR